eukprot:7081405-Prymnesium_polylepis.1
MARRPAATASVVASSADLYLAACARARARARVRAVLAKYAKTAQRVYSSEGVWDRRQAAVRAPAAPDADRDRPCACVTYGSTGTADVHRHACGDAQTTQQCHALSC